MTATRGIPLIRASIFEPCLAAAREIGIPIERHLRLARLPATVIDEPDQLVPEIPCWQFVRSVARQEGIMTYGIVSLETLRFFEIDSFKPLARGCRNLKELLQLICVASPSLSTSALYRLEDRGNAMLLANKGLRLLSDDIQAQLFQVFGMIQLVQLAAGPGWRPQEVHFTFKHNAAIESAAELNPSRILFAQRYPGIVFSRYLLPLSVQHRFNEAREIPPVPERFTDQLSELIALYLGCEPISKHIAAKVAGLSPRTLQRRLDEEHTSFAQLLDRIRQQKAGAMLEDPDIKLIDIALALGYENAPSFTRAFRRWSGVSPREYRQLLSAGHIRNGPRGPALRQSEIHPGHLNL